MRHDMGAVLILGLIFFVFFFCFILLLPSFFLCFPPVFAARLGLRAIPRAPEILMASPLTSGFPAVQRGRRRTVGEADSNL